MPVRQRTVTQPSLLYYLHVGARNDQHWAKILADDFNEDLVAVARLHGGPAAQKRLNHFQSFRLGSCNIRQFHTARILLEAEVTSDVDIIAGQDIPLDKSGPEGRPLIIYTYVKRQRASLKFTLNRPHSFERNLLSRGDVVQLSGFERIKMPALDVVD